MNPRSSSLVLSAFAVTVSLGLSGCGLSTSAADKTPTSVSSAHALGGNLHGGQQPIVGATVSLWAAGVSGTGAAGYGAGSTLIATTTTDSTGSFGFNNSSGASPCTPGQYLYVTATGGGPLGGAVNNSSALMAALPTPCNTGTVAPTASSFVYINEVTTVAAIWSLQQFMKITPGAAVPWRIGAPSSNVAGLAAAFQTSTNLANISKGTTSTSSTSNAVSNTINGVTYTTTIKPDYPKINTLSNILASCVNDSTQCSGLFADTTPSGMTAPTDTIQAGYYLATNPAGLTMNAHGNSAGSPSYLCTQYPSAAAPFQPTLTCSNVYEWTIGVQWKAINGASATVGTIYAASVAIDGSGNIWTGGGSGVTTNVVNEFNPMGQVLITPVSSATIAPYNFNYVVGGSATPIAYPGSTQNLSYGRPYSLSIDTGNNAWFNSYTTAPGTINSGSVSVPTGMITQVSPTGGATGYLTGSAPGALAIDGNNNIFLNNIPQAGTYYLSELPATGNYQTLNEGNGANTSKIYNYVLADPAGNGYGFNNVTTCTAYTILVANNSQEANAATGAGATANSINDTTGCAYYAALDNVGNLWASASGNLYYINTNAGGATSPTVTTVTGSTNTANTTAGGTGGLDNPSGVAVDGAGNVWALNRLSSSTAGLNGLTELVPTTSGLTTTVTALSPSAPAVYGFGSANGWTGANGVVIDASGNLWITTTAGSYLNFIVGAAAPVVTPTSLALKNAAVAVRP